MTDLATSISIIYDTNGLDVLGKLTASTDKATGAAGELAGSLTGLRGEFASLLAPIGAATDGLAGFSIAAIAASRAAQGTGSAAVSGMRDAAAAARLARTEYEGLAASLVGVRTAMNDVALGSAAVGASGSRRAALPSATSESYALDTTASSIASSGFFGGRRPGGVPPSATILGYGPFTAAGSGGALTGGPPITGDAYRMPGTGGSGGGGGNFGGGFAAAAAAGGGSGGDGVSDLFKLGEDVTGRGLPIVAKIGKAGLDFGMKVAKDGALAGIGLAADSVYEAGKLQQQMTIMRVASPGLIANTPKNNAMMGRLQQEAYNISNATAQSVAQSAQLIGIMASSGLNDPNQLLSVGKNGDTFAMDISKFADVQFLKSHGAVSFEAAAKQAIKLAHINGAMTPDKIAPLLDEVTKVSFMMPDNLQSYLVQAGYYQKLYGRFGVPQDQTLMLGAWLDRMGGNTKGGTWLQSVLLQTQKPLQLTGHMQAGRAAAMEHFGIVGRDGKLNPDIFGFDPVTGKPTTQMFNTQGTGLLQQFNATIQHDRAGKSPRDAAEAERKDIQLFNNALGMQGQRIPMLADQQGVDTLLKMVQDANRMPGVKQAQQLFMGNFDSQTVRAWSNFQSLLTEVGSQALPGLTKGFSDLGDHLHSAQAWLHNHGDLEMRIQRDITGAVKGTEKFIIDNKSTWTTLGKDINLVMTDVEKSGPVFSALGDAVVTAVKVIDVGVKTVQLLLPSNKSKSGVYYGDDGNDLGARAMLPQPPPTAPRGPTVTHVTHVTQNFHFHGPAHPAKVSAAAAAAVNGRPTGTSAHHPAALSVPHY